MQVMGTPLCLLHEQQPNKYTLLVSVLSEYNTFSKLLIQPDGLQDS